MKINKLILYSDQIENQKSFFNNTLGFKILNETNQSFSVSIGWTILCFKYRKKAPKYHYCFLIPSNKLEESISWLADKLDIVKSENNKIIHHFVSWNAKSIYFYDGNENLAEFIVRYDLHNESTETFDSSLLLCVNEIGLATNNIKSTHELINSITGSPFWKGGMERFGTNGDQHGIFLMVNHQLKKTWFPTTLSLEPAPFQATIEVDSNQFQVDYELESLNISKL